MSNVFVNEQMQLQSLIPLGAVLTWAGLSAACTYLEENGRDTILAPELGIAVKNNIKSYLTDSEVAFEHAFAADCYSAAAIAAQVLGHREGSVDEGGSTHTLN